jgi:hypothetical protein
MQSTAANLDPQLAWGHDIVSRFTLLFLGLARSFCVGRTAITLLRWRKSFRNMSSKLSATLPSERLPFRGETSDFIICTVCTDQDLGMVAIRWSFMAGNIEGTPTWSSPTGGLGNS